MTDKLPRSWVFGTATDCDIRLDDKYASSHHCKVTLTKDGNATIEDLGSTNGTWIRSAAQAQIGKLKLPGRRIYGPTPIQPGCIIRVGHTDIPWTDQQ